LFLQHNPTRKSARVIPQNAPAYENDDEVLSFAQWCRLNGISPRTGWRILNGPDPPARTKLSERRFGITRRNNRLWQARRERG
jgi:hypothetical protein